MRCERVWCLYRCFMVSCFVILCGCATQPPDPLLKNLQPAAGFEAPLPAQIENLAAQKTLIRTFTLSGPGYVRVEWAVAQGHQLNVWLLNEEQYRRANVNHSVDSGHYMHAELQTSQGTIASSAPGRGLYYVLFANPNGHPVRIVTRVLARR